MPSVAQRIASELAVAVSQVQAAVDLLEGGATVPFVARYRKEATGGLDDAQLRTLEERLRYLKELDGRRDAILRSVEDQGKLTDTLRAAIAGADTKARLEDIYLPYKPRRRTRAQAAREAGLGPLADLLLSDPATSPEAAAAAFVSAERDVADVDAALSGARAIVVETMAEDGELVGSLREDFWKRSRISSKVREGKEREGEKFADYFDFSEPLAKLPSHRVLALFRAEKEEVIDLSFPSEGDGEGREMGDFERRVAARHSISDKGRPGDRWLCETVRTAWRYRMRGGIEVDTRVRLKESADAEAIRVFSKNLKDLLLAAPAGQRATLGLDPGFRTGVKVAVVDGTGKVAATDTVYPHEPHGKWHPSIQTLATLCRRHGVELVAVGNGTASRETDRLVADLLRAHPDLELVRASVSEAGASVYSASAYASAELPGMDVSLRGAVSIARRLQDPLAELVKIDPKSIGVGQYQHDVEGHGLSRALDAVVEDCVHRVGVDVNTASVPLLTRVSGIGEWVAGNIVAHRDANGPFRTREALKEVLGLGPKSFELSAGFLRIRGGDEPLDASGVHPEAYPIARRIVDSLGGDIRLVAGGKSLAKVKADDFAEGSAGAFTVRDILRELEKPGRDPRPAFKGAEFKEGVEKVSDLKPGMLLEGVVTNVAAFGAFVDVGVHEDGLVHVSALSERYVKDPGEVVRSGQVVKVKVMEVDVARKRIALSMRLGDPIPEPGTRRDGPSRGGFRMPAQAKEAGGGAFAAAFAKAGLTRS